MNHGNRIMTVLTNILNLYIFVMHRSNQGIMKKILLLALAIICSTTFFGQEIRFVKKCGSRTSDVVYKAIGRDSLEILIGRQKSFHRYDAEHRNTSWRFCDPGSATDVFISLKDGTYHIVGTSNGNRLDKYVKSNGLPWIQNMAYFCGILVPAEGEMKYECFRPGTFTLHRMCARVEKKESYGNRTCVRVYPDGFAAKLFHADYFYSAQTGKLNGYRCVEGMPGTPETTWTLCR